MRLRKRRMKGLRFRDMIRLLTSQTLKRLKAIHRLHFRGMGLSTDLHQTTIVFYLEIIQKTMLRYTEVTAQLR